MTVASVVIQVLLGGVFLLAGLSKIAGAKQQVERFNGYRFPQWFRVFTGLVEIVAAAGLVAGIWVPEVAIAAAALLVVTMAVATWTHIFREKVPRSASATVPLLTMALAIIVLRATD